MKHIFFVMSLIVAGHVAAYAQEFPNFSAFGKLPVRTPDSLLQHWNQAKNIQDKYQSGVALLHFHENTGTTDSVLIYARMLEQAITQSTLTAAQKQEFSLTIDNAFANAYKQKGLFDEALRHYLQGIATAEHLGKRPALEENRAGMGDVYFLRKEYNKALPVYQEVLKTATDPDLVQRIHKQLGVIYRTQNNWATARNYLNKALVYFQRTQQLKNELETRLNLAMIDEAHNQLDTAFNTYNTIKTAAEQAQYYDLYIAAGQRMGDILFAKKDYENAQMVLTMVYANAMQWEDLEAQQGVLVSLQRLYTAMGDYKNAYALTTQLINVTREVAAQQNKREVNELEIKYNTAQKEKALLQKENQLQQQRTIKYGLLIGFIVVLLPIVGLLYLYYQKLQTQSRLNASQEEANRQRIMTMLKEKELEVLKASVDGEEKERARLSKELHDSIGGNLAAIKMQLAHKNETQTVVLLRQLDDTYQQVRDLSHNLAPKHFQDTGFTDLINGYLHRYNGPGLEVRFNAYPAAAVNQMPAAIKVEVYKMMQELMTNAQKHADASIIELQLTQVEGGLQFIFEDNGKGFRLDKTREGIGLQNIRERLERFNGTLEIDSFPGRGTVVSIAIPFNQQEHEA